MYIFLHILYILNNFHISHIHLSSHIVRMDSHYSTYNIHFYIHNNGPLHTLCITHHPHNYISRILFLNFLKILVFSTIFFILLVYLSLEIPLFPDLERRRRSLLLSLLCILVDSVFLLQTLLVVLQTLLVVFLVLTVVLPEILISPGAILVYLLLIPSRSTLPLSHFTLMSHFMSTLHYLYLLNYETHLHLLILSSSIFMINFILLLYLILLLSQCSLSHYLLHCLYFHNLYSPDTLYLSLHLYYYLLLTISHLLSLMCYLTLLILLLTNLSQNSNFPTNLLVSPFILDSML